MLLIYFALVMVVYCQSKNEKKEEEVEDPKQDEEDKPIVTEEAPAIEDSDKV